MRTATPDGIIQLANGFKGAKALLSAVELGVFTVLADGPLDAFALRTRVGIDARGARDFLDALVALGMLERDANGRYTNTPETDLYLDRAKPNYIGALLDHLGAREYPHWNLLTAALRTGQPQSGARAVENFGAYYRDDAVRDNFAKGMTGGSLSAAQAIAEKFPWRDHKTLIDIGTSEGCLPVQVALAHPHVTGGGFDLPALAPLFNSYVAKHGLASRLRFHGGDFFNEPLPHADVIVMGRILHNWDLATKRMLLAKVRDALPDGGALIVYERLIDDDRRSSAAGLLGSLHTLIMSAGGFDFTARDCIGWMREAGFRDMHVEPLAALQTMIVAHKRSL